MDKLKISKLSSTHIVSLVVELLIVRSEFSLLGVVPGGDKLVEVDTLAPGFTVDEPE